MPRSFDLTADYHGTVEQVHSAFSDEEYWLARLADSGADTATLNSMTVADNGAVAVATTQTLRIDRLPGMVIQFHPHDLEIVRNEIWSPVSAGVAHAEVSGTVPGAPVSLVGAAVLTPTNAGSRQKFTAKVAVNIPLVGGKLEDFIGRTLVDLLAAEQRFTTIWITDNT